VPEAPALLPGLWLLRLHHHGLPDAAERPLSGDPVTAPGANSQEVPDMRFVSPYSSRVLILAALCAVLAAAAGFAASAPQPPATAAGFLASLSAAPPPAVSGAAQLPSTGALFLSGCAGGCPPGQTCCSQGADPDGGSAFACVVVPHGKCPPVQ
jgi:hypothetical protein